MHFRLRNNVVQVIRTTYDATTKKAKNEIVGRLTKGQPQIDDMLRANCSPAELAEIQRWIDSEARLHQLAGEFAARTAAQQMEKAAEWMSSTDPETARSVALDIQRSWVRLRSVMKRRGLLD